MNKLKTLKDLGWKEYWIGGECSRDYYCEDPTDISDCDLEKKDE